MPERVKLAVLEIRDVKSIGEKGAQKLEFKAKDGEHERWYFTFSKRLFPLILKDATFEADVVTEVRVVGDNTYTDRKVTEIYVDGQPSRLPQALAGVQMGFQKDTVSIERQVAFKGIIELLVAKVVTLDSPYGKAAIDWAMGKLGVTIPAPGNGGSERKAKVEIPTAPPATSTKTLLTPAQEQEIKRLATKFGYAKNQETQTTFYDLLKTLTGKTTTDKVTIASLLATEADAVIKALQNWEEPVVDPLLEEAV